MYKCKLCNAEFEQYNSLSRHNSKTHQIKVDQCFVDYNLNGIWPLCKCKCNQKTKYSYELKGFRDYCQGHQSRVNNNWGHNKAAIEKSAGTRRKLFLSGELKTWNAGLDSTDIRVKNNAINSKNAINSNPFELIRRAKLMSDNRFNGTIPTLKGKNHSQWKGGASSINVLVRARSKLYSDWKFPILVRDEFKCVTCGNTDKLHVHHDKETMSEIVAKHMVDELDDIPFELKEVIADKVVEYHINNKVSGIALCSKCHNDLHPSLNFNSV